MAPITINGNILDIDSPSTRAKLSFDLTKSKYWVVQFKQELSHSARTTVTQSGIELLEYVGSCAYVCHFTGKDVNIISKSQLVKQAFVYPTETSMSMEINAASSTTNMNFAVLAHEPEGAAGAALTDQIKQKAPGAKVLRTVPGAIEIQASKDDLKKIAGLEAVSTIEEVTSMKRAMNLVRDLIGVSAIQSSSVFSWKSNQFFGKGQVVALADSGLGTGSPGPKRDFGHPAFADQVISTRRLDQTSMADKIGHGTFMAGCIAGAPVSVTDERLAAKGEKTGTCTVQGVAPKAKLFVLSFTYENLLANLEDIFTVPYETGTTDPKKPRSEIPAIHNNSWWSVAPGRTDKQSGYGDLTGRKVDHAMFANRNLLACMAAGNDGRMWTDTGAHICQTSAAKNALVSGAVCNARPLTDDCGWIWNDYDRPSVTCNLADLSNRGPCQNGRLKPDLVAPGAGILAPLSPLVSVMRSDEKGTQSEDPKYEPLDSRNLRTNAQYIVDNGTSAAIAIVSGSAALIREALANSKNKKLENPTGALLKAILINGTQDLAGRRALIRNEWKEPNPDNAEKPLEKYQNTWINIPKAPNGLQGFGLVNVPQSLKCVLAETNSQGGFLEISLNQDPTTRVDVVKFDLKAASDVCVTLTWTDAPGEALQSYVALGVVSNAGAAREESREPDEVQEWRCLRDGQVWPRQGLAGEQPMSMPRDAQLASENNVQKVTWKAMPAGTVTISLMIVRLAAASLDCAVVWSVG